MADRFYLEAAETEFKRTKRLADGALSQLGDERLFLAPAREENSPAILMKHMSGNMLSRWRDFLASDGEKPDRQRDLEFVILPNEDHRSLQARWDRGWDCLFTTLASLSDADLTKTVSIRGEPHSVLQAINRQLTHYAYHAGQIAGMAKMALGQEWQSLSIPKGQSEQFNEAPQPYLPEDP